MPKPFPREFSETAYIELELGRHPFVNGSVELVVGVNEADGAAFDGVDSRSISFSTGISFLENQEGVNPPDLRRTRAFREPASRPTRNRG